MRKSKIFTSLLSIFLAIGVMVFVFAPNVFADIKFSKTASNDFRESLGNFGDSVLGKLKNNDNIGENSRNNTSKAQKTAEEALTYVYVGGTPLGLKLYCDGVIIVGMDAIETDNGRINPAQKAGLCIGDVIKKVNGTEVKRNSDVSEIIEKCQAEPMIFDIVRNGANITVNFSSAYSAVDGRYKAGLWIRDSCAGIGTLSFSTKDGEFAALGHAVCDVDTGEIMPLNDGETTKATITGLYKGTNGSPGELCGVLERASTGQILKNDSIGIYGRLNTPVTSGELLPIAEKGEAVTGKAEIISTIEDGKTEHYEIEITKTDASSTENKNLVIKVTDAQLIAKSGGIIQGMSGSPIIQNGKIIGAVTHVFLNDPTGGYGIFSSTMLEKINEIKNLSQ